MVEITYTVPGMSCEHCVRSISAELERVAGVAEVAVELEAKRVLVRGELLDDRALRAAIADAGYEAR
jgi:copper chaperone CopZ